MDYFKTARFFLYAALFAVVIVTSGTLFPFIVGKYVFFRICTGLAVISFCLGLILKDEKNEMLRRMKEIAKNPLAIGVFIYIATFVLAGFFGVNPSASFWSNFERGEGGLQLLNLGAYFFLCAVLFKDWKQWKLFFTLWITSSALLMLYGIGAGLGLHGFVGEKFASGMRFAGSLGNPAYVGTFMLFTMAFSLIAAFRAITKQEKKWFFGIAALSLLSSWMSQTRGAFLGFAVGTVVALFFVALKNQALRKKALGVLAILIVISSTLIAFRSSSTLQKIPGFRVFTISLQEQTAQTRLWTWNSALKGFKERPIFGWGPENFSMVFDKYFDHRHFDAKTGGGETWFDRAHSLYFDALAETGIVGFLGLLSVICAFFFVWHKSKDVKHISLGERATLLGIMIMYLVQGIVLFDIFPSFLALFSLLAYTTSRIQAEQK